MSAKVIDFAEGNWVGQFRLLRRGIPLPLHGQSGDGKRPAAGVAGIPEPLELLDLQIKLGESAEEQPGKQHSHD